MNFNLEKIKEFLADKQEIDLPELQQQFGLDYYSLTCAVKKLEEEKILVFDKGVVYKVNDTAQIEEEENVEYLRNLEERRKALMERLKAMNGIEDDDDDNCDYEEDDIDEVKPDTINDERVSEIARRRMELLERYRRMSENDEDNDAEVDEVDADDENEDRFSDSDEFKTMNSFLDLAERFPKESKSYRDEVLFNVRRDIFGTLTEDDGRNVFNDKASERLRNLYGTGQQITVQSDNSRIYLTDKGAALTALMEKINIYDVNVKAAIDIILEEYKIIRKDLNELCLYIDEIDESTRYLMNLYAAMERVRNLYKDKFLLQELRD